MTLKTNINKKSIYHKQSLLYIASPKAPPDFARRGLGETNTLGERKTQGGCIYEKQQSCAPAGGQLQKFPVIHQESRALTV